MKVIVNSLSNYFIPCLKDNALPIFSASVRKIIIAVSVAFCLLSLYCLIRYCNRFKASVNPKVEKQEENFEKDLKPTTVQEQITVKEAPETKPTPFSAEKEIAQLNSKQIKASVNPKVEKQEENSEKDLKPTTVQEQITVKEAPETKSTSFSAEKEIAQLNSKQIETVAKKMIAIAMDCLEIDVCNKALVGETYKDLSGNVHQVYWNQYDPSSKFMKGLLSGVIKKVSDAFGNPKEFLEKGMTWQFDSLQQLCDQFTDKDFGKKIFQDITEKMKNKDEKTFEFNLKVRLDKKILAEKSSLYFDMDYIIMSSLGNHGGDLKSLEKSAVKYMV